MGSFTLQIFISVSFIVDNIFVNYKEIIFIVLARLVCACNIILGLLLACIMKGSFVLKTAGFSGQMDS